MVRILSVVLCCLGIMGNVAWANTHDISISSGFVRAPIPGTVNTAGYFTIKNSGDNDITFVAAKSSVAKVVEFHDHIMLESGMRMVKLDSVTVKAGDALKFSSGGKHLMFFNVSTPLPHHVEIQLITDKGDIVPAHLMVKSVMQEHHH